MQSVREPESNSRRRLLPQLLLCVELDSGLADAAVKRELEGYHLFWTGKKSLNSGGSSSSE